MMIAKTESHHVSRELCIRTKPQHAVEECLLLCRVMTVAARNVLPFGPGWPATLLLPACYIVVYVYLLSCRSTKAGPGVQGYLLQGASMLLSPSEICFHFLQLLTLRPCGTSNSPFLPHSSKEFYIEINSCLVMTAK